MANEIKGWHETIGIGSLFDLLFLIEYLSFKKIEVYKGFNARVDLA